MKRVGFVINSRVPEAVSLKKGMRPHALVFGWDDAASPMSFMRFHWIAEALRGRICYELFRPWRRYDAVVFLKSMGSHCMALARRLRERGTKVVFEANVNYYTEFDGAAEIAEMAPAQRQREDAVEITGFADLVIGSSRHLSEVCSRYNRRAEWVPDNVNFSWVRPVRPADPSRPLNVWWSGMAAKAFELLVADEALRENASGLHLHLVTDDLAASSARWPGEVARRMDALLAAVPHTVHRFSGIPDLLAHYSGGGVIVSPRSLRSPYNHSHTEWKLTLGMAAGLPAIGSPVPSYVDVKERAQAGAMTICESMDDWREALGRASGRPGELAGRGMAAADVVRRHYETSVVASKHSACIEALWS